MLPLPETRRVRKLRKEDMRVMAAERFNDPFAFPGLGLDYSQWQVASNELWAPLTLATQEGCAQCRTAAKQWLEFIQRRVTENWTLAEHLAACRSPNEVWSLYTEFLRKAAADYQQEFSVLGLEGSEFLSQMRKKSSEVPRSTLQ
jgi:hypothetical protein